VIVAGKQSQANKNYWAAYAIWQAKVAEARARRRAAELARRRAEAETQLRQLINQYGSLLRLLLVLGVVVFTLLSLIPQSTKPNENIYAKPLIPEQSQTACLNMRFVPFWVKVFLCALSGSVVLSPTDELVMFNFLNTMILDMNESVTRELVITQARAQIATAVEEARQEDAEMQNRHIALGRSDIDRQDALTTFVINLNLILNPMRINVYAFIQAFSTQPEIVQYFPNFHVPDWTEGGITNQHVSSSIAFAQVVEKVSVIHFNLEGIGTPQEALDWAKQEGRVIPRLNEFYLLELSQNRIPPEYALIRSSFITANELLFISTHKDICAKTIFYSSRGNIPLNPPPQLALDAKAIICA